MSKAIPSPTIPLSPPVNLRDLGGTSTATGPVRPGFAIRADDLSVITDDFAVGLVRDGLRTVIDLRSHAEVDHTGRGPLAHQLAVSYHHVPLLDDLSGPGRNPAQPLDQSTFADFYEQLYETAAASIVMSLAIMAYAPGTTAFHCAAGQDRTGILAAALLLALHADQETVIGDYLRTGPNGAAIMARLAPVHGRLLIKLGIDLEHYARSAKATPFSDAPIRSMLTRLTERHGDPLAPLRTAGLSEDLITRLRTRAVGR